MSRAMRASSATSDWSRRWNVRWMPGEAAAGAVVGGFDVVFAGFEELGGFFHGAVEDVAQNQDGARERGERFEGD